MKKISFLVNSLGGGGAERVVSNFVNKLNKEYEIILFVIFPVFKYNIPKDVKVISLLSKRYNKLLLPFMLCFAAIKYLFLVRKYKIETAISFLLQSNLINCINGVFNSKVKTIISERNYPSIMYASSKIRLYVTRFLIRLFYSKSDVVFSNSIAINEDLKNNFGLRPKRIEVIYNPILVPEFKVSEESMNAEELCIVTVGRVIEIKNHKMIIDAIHQLNQFNVTLNIYGQGELKSKLIEYSRLIGVEQRILFKGFAEDVLESLRKNQIFVLSSDSEGFPNALLEAMSVGLPVISTNCKSGPLELLNENIDINIPKGSFHLGKYGLLVNVRDIEGLTKAIQYLASDREEMLRYSSLSKKRSYDFDISVIVEQFKNLL